MSQKPKGIAARAGRWSAQHRKTAILRLAGLRRSARSYIGGPLGTGTKKVEQIAPRRRPGRAQIDPGGRLRGGQQARRRGDRRSSRARRSRLTDPRVPRRGARTSRSRSAPRPEVQQGRGSLRRGSRQGRDLARQAHACRSASRSPATRGRPKERVEATLAATKSLQKAHPGVQHLPVRGREHPRASSGGVFEKDMQKAETMSLPITLIILLLAFGAPRRRRPAAAARPHRRGGRDGRRRDREPARSRSATRPPTSSCWSASPSAWTTRCSTSAASVKSARPGESKEAALNAAAATSGRTVLISGPDRHGRHGRPVLRRRPDVRRARHRVDHRRRRSRCSGRSRCSPRCSRRSATASTAAASRSSASACSAARTPACGRRSCAP